MQNDSNRFQTLGSKIENEKIKGIYEEAHNIVKLKLKTTH